MARLNQSMSEIPFHRLGGETDPNAWNFTRRDEVGPLPNPVGHTFPLLTHEADERWRIVGTGFYVSDDGLFATARHVVEEVLRDGQQILPLIILHPRSESGLFGPSETLFRPLGQCWLSDRADVAFGAAATATNNATGEVLRHWCWPICWSVPQQGLPAATYAFPNHLVLDDGHRFRFSPHLYNGHIQETGNFLDRVMVPYPYLQVDFRIHGTASGGPIVVGGDVVGINCTELSNNIDHPPGPGFGALCRCLADAFLDNAVLRGESSPRRVTFDELVRAGWVHVSHYQPRDRDEPLRGTLIRLDMPASAPRPAIEFEVHV